MRSQVKAGEIFLFYFWMILRFRSEFFWKKLWFKVAVFSLASKLLIKLLLFYQDQGNNNKKNR